MDRGFAETDVAQIAKKAGVAKGSLYNYFQSKEDLCLFVCRDGIERSRKIVYDEIGPDWDIYRQIDHIFRQGITFAQAHPEYIRLYLNVSSAGMERFSDQLTLGRLSSPESVAESVFRAAERDKHLLVLTGVGRLTRLVTKMSPAFYEWIMVRSLRSELHR